MNRNINRIISTVLCLVLILSALALTVGAELGEINKVTVLPKRFCTSEMTVENAIAEKNNNGSVSLAFNGSTPKISMEISPLRTETKANALRIVLQNESTVNTIRLDYIYKDQNGMNKSESSYADIHKKPESVEYIVPISEVDNMTKLVINFNSDENASGKITIVSIGAISYCVDDAEYVGALVSNDFNSITNSATFSGTVSYDTVLENPNGKVVLYKLDSNESIEDVDFTHPCVASCPITLNFKFDFKVKSVSDICARYFAAVLTENNDILPITPETCLTEISCEDNISFESDIGFKGIETSFYAGAVENGTSVAFVDIYLNNLENIHGDGYQYILDDGQEYYFDRNYIAELDATIKSYNSANISVYLRFLVDAYDTSFSTAEWNGQVKGVEYFGIDTRNDEVVNKLYACADFIVSRYTGEEFDSLRGVVLGRTLDRAYQYNYCGMMPMAEYADVLARTFGILKQVGDKKGKALEVVLPMSNNVLESEALINADNRDKNYPSNMLSECVVRMVKQYGFNLSSLYFMLESTEAPIVSQQFVGATDCLKFINSVNILAHKYDGMSDEILFCWYPDTEMASNDITASYVYNYNLLSCIKGVRSYVVSIVNKKSNDLTLEKNVFNSLKSIYKYSDTQNNYKIGESVLSILGKESWQDVFEGYSESEAVKKVLKEESLLYSFPSELKGSYTMWDFSKLSGTAGWGASDGCSSLMIYTPSKDLPRALAAEFKPGAWSDFGADYGSITYQSSDLLTKEISGMSFDLLLTSHREEDGMFEIKITFGSDDSVLETSGVIKENTRTTVYADVSKIDKVEYVKISVRSLEGTIGSYTELFVNSIDVHSEKYNDNELEDMVSSGKITGDDGDKEIMTKWNVVFGVIMLAGVAAVLVFWGAFSAAQKREK